MPTAINPSIEEAPTGAPQTTTIDGSAVETTYSATGIDGSFYTVARREINEQLSTQEILEQEQQAYSNIVLNMVRYGQAINRPDANAEDESAERYCNMCGDLVEQTEGLREYAGGALCSTCRRETPMQVCNRCDRAESLDVLIQNEGHCRICAENAPATPYSTQTMRKPAIRSKELQGGGEGGIIKSSRKFGIELEALSIKSQNLEKFSHDICGAFGIVRDGSLSPSGKYGCAFEIVSPPMSELNGENAVLDIQAKALEKKLGVNNTCGYHLHLEAPEFVRNKRKDRQVIDHSKPQANFEYKYKDRNGRERRSAMLPEDVREYEVIARPERKMRIINNGDEFFNLRNIFQFYCVFDDVFRAMQPKSRRMSRYCRALSTLYSFDEIGKLGDYGEIERLWYREQERARIEQMKGEHYNGTRYSGLNLHSLFSKGKTIELRYHSPTLNAEKILRWVDIHQRVFDYVLSGRFNLDNLATINTECTNIKQKAEALSQVIDLPEATREYMLGRIRKFIDAGGDSEVQN